MSDGTVRVWIDGVAFESPYTDIESRQKAITKSIFNNASIGSQISIDIIPNIQRKEHYVTEEYKKGGYSWEMLEKSRWVYNNRKKGIKNFRRPGSRTKKGVCFKCIGIAVYSLPDRDTVYSLAI